MDRNAARESVLPLLEQLVAIPTWEGNTEANALRFLQDWLQRYGIRSELREQGGDVLALVSRLGSEAAAPLIFNSHVDTVPPAELDRWESDPYTLTRAGENVVGLGAADAKGSVAAMVCAYVALHEVWPDDAALELMIVGAEERGGLGTRLVAAGGLSGAAIVGEPTSLVPCVACKGVVRTRIVCHGKAAHASSPELGINALYPIGALLLELEALGYEVAARHEKWTGKASLAVTLIEGGTAHNVIPAACAIHVDRRLVPGERADEAIAQIEERIAAVKARYPRARFERVTYRTIEPVSIDPEEPIVAACRAAAPERGLSGFTACCDLSHIVELGGIPGVVWGPGPLSAAHQVNEALPVAELEAAVGAYYDAALAWARRSVAH